MVPELRRRYNAAFSEARYRAMLAGLGRVAGSAVEFRISETPLFFSAEITRQLVEASHELLAAVTSPAYLEAAGRALPPGLATPGPEGHPAFVQLDFALAATSGDTIEPRLIELQGFPSLYGFQWLLDRAYRDHFEAVPADWTPYFGGLDAASYAECLRDLIVGDADPETVVLLELDPPRQKTWIDFVATERLLGIPTVAAEEVVERGGRLYYRAAGREVPIRRLYNRVIRDELERKGIALDHLFHRELDVEWVGHPNWFFKISKFTLPFLESRWVPESRFVADFERLPDDLESFVLKPLFSFAGLGVEMEPSPGRLRALERPEEFILQRKVDYAPAVATPDGPAKAEVRMMFVWKDRPLLVNNLVRMSKGLMMGVDFNKDQTWIGASVGLHPPEV